MCDDFSISIDDTDMKWAEMVDYNDKVKPDLSLNESVDTAEVSLNGPDDVSKPNSKTRFQYYLTKENLFQLKKQPVLVDIQFVDRNIYEIAVASPNLPIMYHRIYPPQKKRGQNQKTVSHNVRYTGAILGNDSFQIQNDLMCDSLFWTSIPDDVVFVVRGSNKLRCLKKLWKQNCGRGVEEMPPIYTYPQAFPKDFLRDLCSNHRRYDSYSKISCAVYNVIHMCKYYRVYSHLYNDF